MEGFSQAQTELATVQRFVFEYRPSGGAFGCFEHENNTRTSLSESPAQYFGVPEQRPKTLAFLADFPLEFRPNIEKIFDGARARETCVMFEYKFYSVGSDGHIVNRRDIEAADDLAALEIAKQIGGEYEIEIWEATRFVTRIARDGGASKEPDPEHSRRVGNRLSERGTH